MNAFSCSRFFSASAAMVVTWTDSATHTPNGRSIQAEGIVPDIALDSGDDSVALALHEADLAGHLQGEQARKWSVTKDPGHNLFNFVPAVRPKRSWRRRRELSGDAALDGVDEVGTQPGGGDDAVDGPDP